jgi:hypothetical protein
MFFILTFLLFTSLGFPSPTFALEEFETRQSIDYQVDNRGHANVKQTLTVKNNLSQIYPKQYRLQLSQPDIGQIKAYDQKGEMALTIEQKDDLTIIDLTLNDPQTGQGKENSFTLEYKVEQFAKIKGLVWEITTPQFNDLAQLESLDLTLNIPLSFGNLTYTSQKPQKNSQSSLTYRQILYQKPQLSQKILLAFGQYQLFDFQLKYHLENQSSENQKQEIPIPPSTLHQLITIKELSPRPENINPDQDGNWLAQYTLEPQTTLDISLQGQAKMDRFSLPQSSPPDSSLYTSSSNFWPTQDPTIKSIAQSLSSPRKIYDYVVETLEYDYQNVSANHRQGALSALLNPQHALCTEFTDLFITLSRSRGIPAREVQGFAHTTNPKIKPINQNTDILHAWPEYYDQNKKEWVPVDPTWGKTTGGIDYFSSLDLNHLSFVFHGLDSQLPQSPGFYKADPNQKTIQIDFAKEEIETSVQEAQLELKEEDNALYLYVKNPNNTALFDLNLRSENLSLDQKINTLPPFSYQKLELETQANRLFDQAYLIKLNDNSHLLKNPQHPGIFLPLTLIAVILLLVSTFLFIKKKK